MQYPTLSSSSRAINIASREGYSALYDIVWSFDYAISGNNQTEAGFTVFLTTSGRLNNGNGSIDLGYSGVSATGLPYSPASGILNGVIGVGFDTTGLFAVSAAIGSNTIRDGINEAKRLKNSVAIRGVAPSFSYTTYSYNSSVSALNSTFTITESAEIYKTIRARLGNVGRTLYIDYRKSPTDQFVPLLEQNVSLNLPVSTFYNVGVSFATPISSIKQSAKGNIFIKNFHVEGSQLPNTYKTTVS